MWILYKFPDTIFSQHLKNSHHDQRDKYKMPILQIITDILVLANMLAIEEQQIAIQKCQI